VRKKQILTTENGVFSSVVVAEKHLVQMVDGLSYGVRELL